MLSRFRCLAPALVLAAVLLPAGLGAQQAGATGNAAILALIEKDRVTLGESLVFVAMFAGREVENAQAARTYLVERGILKSSRADSDVLRRGQLAHMIMRAKDWGGGLFYSIFGGRRYAWRELVHRRVMPPSGSEYTPVSGGELLMVIGRAAGEVDLKIQ